MLVETTPDLFDRFTVEAVESDVVAVELDRRRRLNAIDEQTIREFGEIVAALRSDPPGAVVLSSTSSRAFSVGLDLRGLDTDVDIESAYELVRAGQAALDGLERLESPVVAAMRGSALGGGLEVALAADLRIGGQSVTVGQPEVGHGLPPGAGATQRLPAIVGAGRAREMIYTGRRYDAETMRRWGLLNEVVSDDAVVDRAEEVAGSLAASPRSVFGAVERSMRAGRNRPEAGYRVEARAFAERLVEEPFDGGTDRCE